MTRDAGVLRDDQRLRRAAHELASMQPGSVEDANLLTVGRALVAAALTAGLDEREARRTIASAMRGAH